MVWAFLTLLFPLFAHSSESCTEVRLDQNSLRGVPVYDQRGIDNCYAFAVSQAADAYRFSHGDKMRAHLTSPTHLSVLYAYNEKFLPLEVAKDFGVGLEPRPKFKKVSLSYGSPSDTYSILRKSGSCNSYQYMAHRDQLLIEAIWLEIRRLASQADSENRRLEPEEVQCFQEGLAYLPNAGQIIHAFSKAMDKQYPIEIMKAASSNLCRFRTKKMYSLPAKLSGSTSQWEAPEKRLSLINAALDQVPSQPAIVSYCSRVLSDANAAATETKTSSNQEACRDRPSPNDAHVSVVVGRRKAENGKCQLLVRNSWGRGCFDRVHKKPYAWECEGGQIWVDQEVLAKNAYWVSYIPAKPAPQADTP